MHIVLMPVLVTACAGLATVLGALLVFTRFSQKSKLVASSLAFATGVMLCIALGELLPEGVEIGVEAWGAVPGTLIPVGLFGMGALLSWVLDIVFPHEHEHGSAECSEGVVHEEPGHFIDTEFERHDIDRAGKGMVLALMLHNIVEGMATGMTAAGDLRLGLGMALAIALHNIPIGATLALPVGYGGSKGVAIWTALLVGLTQPLGALIGVLFFGVSASPVVMGMLTSFVAGILVFISFDELWPAAQHGGGRSRSILMLLVGICFMLVTERLFH